MNRKIIGVACGLVLVGGLISIWLTTRTEMVRIPREEFIGVQAGLGQALGEEAAKVVPAHGRVVVFVARPFAQFKERANTLWRAFTSELERRGVDVRIEEVAFNAWNTGSMADDRTALQEALSRQVNVGAVVFLVDLPDWGTVQQAFPQYAGPKIIAKDNLGLRTRSRYEGYFVSQMLTALIAVRNQPVSASPAKNPRGWFERSYQIYTPQNYETMPE